MQLPVTAKITINSFPRKLTTELKVSPCDICLLKIAVVISSYIFNIPPLKRYLKIVITVSTIVSKLNDILLRKRERDAKNISL